MELALEDIQRLMADREWETIFRLAESKEWPDEPGSLPLLMGVIWAIQWTHPQGTKYTEAMAYVDHAYRCKPDSNTLAMLQLTEAALRAEVGDAVEAERLLMMEPLASDPRYPWHVRQNLGMCYRQLCRWDESRRYFDAALEAADGHEGRYWQSRLDRALMLVEAGMYSAARDEWGESAPPDKFLGMYYLLGTEVHAATGQFSEALCQGVMALQYLRMADRAINGMPISEYRARVHLALARTHIALGDHQKAIRNCRAVAELGHGCPPTLVRQAEVLGQDTIMTKEVSRNADKKDPLSGACFH